MRLLDFMQTSCLKLSHARPAFSPLQEFGDLTKSAVKAFTGKDTYEFGDVTKKVGQMLFGNKQVKKDKKDK